MKKIQTVKGSSIFIGDDAIVDFKLFLQSFKKEKIFILMDHNTRKYCLDIFLKQFPFLKNSYLLEVQAGELSKSMDSIIYLSDQLIKNRAERGSLLLNLGGGVICDLGGFLSSIFNRKITYCNVPTTLLSQVDASIGGKTGVNFNEIKNKLGTFYHPKVVMILPVFRKTLSKSEIYSGLGEIFKYALIKDEKMWNKLKKLDGMVEGAIEELIINSVKIKSEIVNQDVFDNGVRKILNFGHTIGHAIESINVNNFKFTHGFCVVIGMICESFISNKLDTLSNSELLMITRTLCAYYPLEKITTINKILSIIMDDKKNKNGDIYITTISKIGQANHDILVDKKIIVDSINFYNSLL